jgi:hypothetical protein
VSGAAVRSREIPESAVDDRDGAAFADRIRPDQAYHRVAKGP